MLRPKRRRINYVIIIILGRINDLLSGNTGSGLMFDIDEATRHSSFLYLMDENESGWGTKENDIYDAFDTLGSLIEGEAEESVIEEAYNDWTALM